MLFLTGESGVKNPGVPSKRQNLDNSIVSEFHALMFQYSSIAEMEFLIYPVKIGCGNRSVIEFQMAVFLIYESWKRD